MRWIYKARNPNSLRYGTPQLARAPYLTTGHCKYDFSSFVVYLRLLPPVDGAPSVNLARAAPSVVTHANASAGIMPVVRRKSRFTGRRRRGEFSFLAPAPLCPWWLHRLGYRGIRVPETGDPACSRSPVPGASSSRSQIRIRTFDLQFSRPFPPSARGLVDFPRYDLGYCAAGARGTGARE